MNPSRIWNVYLLKCRDGSLYCGIAINLARRLDQHNGKIPGGAKYTRSRRPVSLLGYLQCASKSDALKLERKIKSLPRHIKPVFFARGLNAVS